ncbi:MAG: DUF4278 domain-containing protein [Leptolyngbyaceae cyanobacterium bins.302]|nr:DUF4278 domain-containing protein [Leptolyngbyaceae cyanobacterium bins.302]
MKLTYRGASYEYNTSPLEVRESDIFSRNWETQRRCQTLQENAYPLTYRGVRYTTDQVATALSTPASRSTQALIYRGVKYARDPDGTTRLSTTQVSIPNTTAVVWKEVSRVHHENIRRNLERRLQAAKARGDQSLINLLEAESKELAL